MLQDLQFDGPGLSLDDILLLHSALPTLGSVKIEVTLPGPKYSAVLAATDGRLHVAGGWAAAQMMEALHRGVHCFIPTAMDRVWVAIHRHFLAGRPAAARALHERLTPVLAFSNQHIDVSIRFFKHLRHREGLFRTAHCRPGVAALDSHQMRELDCQIERVLALQRELAAATAPG
jgi:dihydrodipicolinate synthase/N-acetylneuraminate lyase